MTPIEKFGYKHLLDSTTSTQKAVDDLMYLMRDAGEAETTVKIQQLSVQLFSIAEELRAKLS